MQVYCKYARPFLAVYYPQLSSSWIETICNIASSQASWVSSIDDVEDDSDLRRGVPVAHKIYGIAQTVNCANYVYFMALNEIIKLGNSKMVDIYTEELLNLHKGQGQSIAIA
jgi:geranylgeranyl diphosphate synthase type 3